MAAPTEQLDLVIVGGGPAGLAHAFWRLRQDPNLKVVVIEGAPRVGGWVKTQTVDGYQLELGPQGFRPDESVDLFLRSCGLTEHVIPCAKSATRRFVIRGGAMHELPSKPAALLWTRLASIPAKLRIVLESRVRTKSPPQESVAGFVARRFGKSATPLAEAMMHGIYAGDAHQLEVSAVLPSIVEMERQHGSVLRGMSARRRLQKINNTATRPSVCTFPNGMQQSVDVLANQLGDRIHTNAAVAAISGSSGNFTIHLEHGAANVPDTLQAREVCITTPPRATAAMLRELDEPLTDLLSGIPMVSVASTYVGFEAVAVPDQVDGFGCLAPQGELGSVLGAIYCSRVFPHQAPENRVLFRVMSGGFAFPEEVKRDDDDLGHQAASVLQKYLGIEGNPVFQHVSRAPNAIPQYAAGHCARMQAIRERLTQHQGLTLRGAGYGKVSIVGQWAQEGSTP